MESESATHSRWLALREERDVVREGYRFLDEKRLLLAAEILRELEQYERLRRRYEQAHREAAETLATAVERHGLEGLENYPPGVIESTIEIARRRFLAIVTQSAGIFPAKRSGPTAFDPSPEAEHCTLAFIALLSHATELAGRSGNLERLLAEYRRTARRARALEDVILPELETALAELTARLEETDQEEAVRTRTLRRRDTP